MAENIFSLVTEVMLALQLAVQKSIKETINIVCKLGMIVTPTESLEIISFRIIESCLGIAQIY